MLIAYQKMWIPLFSVVVCASQDTFDGSLVHDRRIYFTEKNRRLVDMKQVSQGHIVIYSSLRTVQITCLSQDSLSVLDHAAPLKIAEFEFSEATGSRNQRT